MNRLVLAAVAAVSASPLQAADPMAVLPPAPSAALEPAPAPVGPPPACRAGVVSGLVAGPWIELLAVRAGPGVEHPILDRLGNGYPLQVCAREGEWFAIVEAGCPVNVLTWEGAPCTKGWSYRRWIVPIPPPGYPLAAIGPQG